MHRVEGGGMVDRGVDKRGGMVDRGMDKRGGMVDRGVDKRGGMVDRGVDKRGGMVDGGVVLGLRNVGMSFALVLHVSNEPVFLKKYFI